MHQIGFSWPAGKAGAFTTSWDDGTIHDRRLVDILNSCGIKGTWNLNGANLRLSDNEIAALYAGHEIASHAFTHPRLECIPERAVMAEIIADRRRLEEAARYPVNGFALPYGSYDARVVRILRECGLYFSRTVRSTNAFSLPGDFLEWHPTCHHRADLVDLWSRFQEAKAADKLFFLWGHSYEFDRDQNWELIENFGQAVKTNQNIWHATNMEVYEYVTAWRELLSCSVDMACMRNRSAVTLWFKVDTKLRMIAPGEVTAL